MTIHNMSLHKEFNPMFSCVIFLCVFFAWLADRIWKISGRKTDSLVNMALLDKRKVPYLILGKPGLARWCVDQDHNVADDVLIKTKAWQMNRLPMAEQVGCGTSCLLWSLGVREVVSSRPGWGSSKESFSSNQETGKVFSPEMPFYSKF